MVRIEIVADLKGRMRQSDQYIQDVIDGKIRPKRAVHTVIFTPDIFAKVFSPERLKLILAVKQENTRNIYQLAKALGRPYEAVHRDITYLEGMGLLKVRAKGRKRLPYVDGAIRIPAFG